MNSYITDESFNSLRMDGLDLIRSKVMICGPEVDDTDLIVQGILILAVETGVYNQSSVPSNLILLCVSPIFCMQEFLLCVLSSSQDVFQQESRVFDSEQRCSLLYNKFSEVDRRAAPTLSS
jgi:hypothetical protein